MRIVIGVVIVVIAAVFFAVPYVAGKIAEADRLAKKGSVGK